jgi:hypothetical protein
MHVGGQPVLAAWRLTDLDGEGANGRGGMELEHMC